MFEGKKVAFVASGGGGKGVAHMGVLKACESMGIKFDLLIGASAGAICIAYYSQSQDSEKLLDLLKPKREKKYNKQFGWRNMISFKNFFSKNIKAGFIDLTGAEEFFKNSFEIDDFKKLDIPIYIAATNLNTGEGELFGPGLKDHIPISKAVVASSCLPIIFRPVKIDNSFYIDGEIKKPISVGRAIDFGADVVIVSDAYHPYTKNIEKTSMFNIAGQMVNMLLEDKSQRGIKIAKAKYPDKEIIFISPKIGNMGVFSIIYYKKLYNMGYNTAIQKLQEYR